MYVLFNFGASFYFRVWGLIGGDVFLSIFKMFNFLVAVFNPFYLYLLILFLILMYSQFAVLFDAIFINDFGTIGEYLGNFNWGEFTCYHYELWLCGF